jgi:two-component system cell cycle sensor histidine kinase/response regulator CckA
VVDDDPQLLGVYKRILEEAGYTVLTATDGDAVLRLCVSFQGAVDVVLMDVVLPGLSGIDLLEIVTAEWPRAKIIVSSGQMKENFQASDEIANRVFLPKPVTPTALLSAISKALAA